MSSRRIIGAWAFVLGSFLAVGAVLALTSCIPEGWDQAGGKWPWPLPPKGGPPPGPPGPLPPPPPPPPAPPPPAGGTPSPWKPPVLAGHVKKVPGPPIPGAPFHVRQCVWEPYSSSVPRKVPVFMFDFSQPVNLSTMKVPQTVRIEMKGGFFMSGKAILPAGNLQFPGPDHRTVRLVSGVDNSGILQMLGAAPGSLSGGTWVTFDVTLRGTDDKGSGVIQDSTGRALDRDYQFRLTSFLDW